MKVSEIYDTIMKIREYRKELADRLYLTITDDSKSQAEIDSILEIYKRTNDEYYKMMERNMEAKEENQ